MAEADANLENRLILCCNMHIINVFIRNKNMPQPKPTPFNVDSASQVKWEKVCQCSGFFRVVHLYM